LGDPRGTRVRWRHTHPHALDELARRTRNELGISDYVPIAQQTVDAFAGVAGGRQWIHTDPARTEASPVGGTIAHGYLTLALAPALLVHEAARLS
jgi:acyl dehydratase